MSALKWIKVDTNIFANEKIKAIKMMKNSDEILVIWFELMALAGRCNNGGLLSIDTSEPMTTLMIANSIGRTQKRVEMAISIFEKYRMVEMINDFFYLSNWEKYQSTDKIERQREQTKIRVARSREKKKGQLDADVTTVTIPLRNAPSNADVTTVTTPLRNAPVTGGEDRSKKIDIDKEKENPLKGVKESGESTPLVTVQKDAETIKAEAAAYPYDKIVEYWNEKVRYQDPAKSKIPSVLKRIGENRRKSIKARIDQFGLDNVYKMIERVFESDHLCGNNRDGWVATLDWCFTDTYFPKIVEGNYDNKKGASNNGNNHGRIEKGSLGSQPAGTVI